jgi:hypothetical protein
MNHTKNLHRLIAGISVTFILLAISFFERFINFIKKTEIHELVAYSAVAIELLLLLFFFLFAIKSLYFAWRDFKKSEREMAELRTGEKETAANSDDTMFLKFKNNSQK